MGGEGEGGVGGEGEQSVEGRIWAWVNHLFGVILHVFGWRQLRFRGIFKNFQYAFGITAAVNVSLHREM